MTRSVVWEGVTVDYCANWTGRAMDSLQKKKIDTVTALRHETQNLNLTTP